MIVAPSRVDEVLMPSGELTIDAGVFRGLFGKPISGTVPLRDLFGRDEQSEKRSSSATNTSGKEQPANEKPNP